MSTVTSKPRNIKPVTGTALWIVRPAASGFGLLSITTDTGTKRYSVLQLPQGGYRLMSECGDVWDVDVTEQPWSCSCPDHVYNRAGKDQKGCRHVAGLRAALAAIGQLPPAPAPAAAKPTPAVRHRSLSDRLKNDPPQTEEDWGSELCDIDALLDDEPAASHFGPPASLKRCRHEADVA